MNILQFSCKGRWKFALCKEVTDNPYLKRDNIHDILQAITILMFLRKWCHQNTAQLVE